MNPVSMSSASRTASPAQPLTEGSGEGTHARRVEALVGLYQHIAATRMQGMPLLHPGLQVAAVGFAPEPADATTLPASIGVLLTPWFMNLVWLPLAPLQRPDRLGQSSARPVGTHSFAFIGMHDDGLGSYAACSLFSPVLEFEDQGAALATAQSVLELLRRPVMEPEEATAMAPEQAAAVAPLRARAVVPARRAFLLGRGGAHA